MRFFSVFVLGILFLACSAEENNQTLTTEHVVLLVIDGPRYSESWGDTTHSNIPQQWNLRNQGVILTNFQNKGITYTNSGHATLLTGFYENIANNGSQFPLHPTLMQRIIQQYGNNAAALIASKDKLHVLKNCQDANFANQFPCYIDCGINGDGTGGYRSDSITQAHVIEFMNQNFPKLLVVNYKDPDVFGHNGDSLNYIASIQKTDQYVEQVWAFIQSNPVWKNKTTLIVTNDHGRHLNGTSNGYISHGDNCSGCQHIGFFAISPDFKKNRTYNSLYEQNQLAATIAKLLKLPLTGNEGKKIGVLFK